MFRFRQARKLVLSAQPILNAKPYQHFLVIQQLPKIKTRHFSTSEELKPENRFQMERPKSNLTEYGGNKAVLKSLENIILYLQDPVGFLKKGHAQPKGVIFSGPPGVGKTFLAKLLAGHSGVPIFVVSATELIHSHVGKTEENLRLLFNTARKNTPCIVLFDEIDSIALNRNRSEAHQWDRTSVNQLLTLLSDKNPGVVVIATTNNYHMLDPAVVRPGRFDQHIVLSLPDRDARLGILKVYLKDKQTDSTVELDELVELSAGYSGAQIESWIQKTQSIALKNNREAFSIRDFDRAKILMDRGIEETVETDPVKKRNVAIHEMGHTLVGHLLGRKLYRTSIKLSGDIGGFSHFHLNDQSSLDSILDRICIALAGRAAEKLYGLSMMGAYTDIEMAKELAIRLINDGHGSTLTGFSAAADLEDILKTQLERALAILTKHKKEGEYIIEVLVKKDELFGHEISSVMQGKKLSKNIFELFSSLNEAKEPEFVLPPPKKQFQRGFFFNKEDDDETDNATKDKSFPFSIADIEKAFEVARGSIGSIVRESGGWSIHFKPHFLSSKENEWHMEEITYQLDRHHVCHRFWSFGAGHIQIFSTGCEDFLKFVEKKTGKKPAP